MGEVAVAMKCIHCGKAFYGPRETVVVGEKSGGRLMKHVGEMAGHIKEAHAEEFKRALVLGAELQGFLLMQQFTGEDATVRAMRDEYRWRIHQATLQLHISENAVARKARETVAAVVDLVNKDFEDLSEKDKEELRNLIQAPIEKVLLELREILQEPGKYAPQAIPDGQPAAVVG